jgi:hypothetical protein
MPLIPLKIPAGMYRNGTEYEAAGRWRDGNLVRWLGASLRPVGGWRERITDAIAETARSIHAWQDSNNSRWAALATYNKLYVTAAAGTVYDITPGGFQTGDDVAVIKTGYGYSTYGTSFYGTERPDTGSYSEVTTWSLDNFGNFLVGCSVYDGKVYQWDGNISNGAEIITNGSFDTNSDWILGAGWVINTNSAPTYVAYVASNVSTHTHLEQSGLSLVAGQRYRLRCSIRDLVGTMSVEIGHSFGAPGEVKFLDVDPYKNTPGIGENGGLFQEFEFTATETNANCSIRFRSNQVGGNNYWVDNVSIQALPMAQVVSGAPTDNLGLIVTEERFLFCLGGGGDPRTVQWSDQEDITTWTPASTNQAGAQILQTSGQIMAAQRGRGQTLIFTDLDMHRMTYVGAPFVYSTEKVAEACGLVSRKAVTTVDAGTFWMGHKSFFFYNGSNVQELKCDVKDYVFGDINSAQISKSWSMALGQQGEIWWFYCSSGSNEIDRYVSYDYKQGHWMTGALSRTCGADRGVFDHPLMMSVGGTMYDHESGLNYEGATVFAETGPFSIGSGDNLTKVTKLIPDELTQGDVTATFKTRLYPNGSETSHGPFDMANPTSVRFSGRQARMRVEGARLADWRVGVMRVEAVTGGKR